ncbi:E3 ubiquitin-protein ligase TRIM45-like [Saccostrea echinata]|uniref:E3 ubiquitin-protein ligase TRIM45-like n=1 Tax=Saccostrea echinata TaxID=191078 RepID=UPI002A813663|nr:E3 ubiquitin-protein ligase TRIM45-like [Saccostrea echinata]
MATAQGQDVIRCKLCPEPVDFHCNLCSTDLCSSCVLRHMMDKSRNHEVVAFESRKNKMENPECQSHKIKCETYCRDCKASICIKCVIGSHKGHDVMEIDEIVQMQRKRIESDIKDLEENALCRIILMKEINSSSNAVIDNVIDEITQRENQIKTAVHNMAEKMRNNVVLNKKRNTAVISENQSKISNLESRIKQVIEKNNHILQSRRIQDILNYENIKEDFKTDLNLEKCVYPHLVCSEIENDQIVRLLGNLSCEEIKAVKQDLHLKETPEILHSCTLQSSNKSLWRILCVGNNTLWVSGEKNSIKQIDRHGAPLQTINTTKTPVAFSFDNHDNWKSLTFAVNDDSNVYIVKDNKVEKYLNCDGWLLKGLCCLRNRNMLVSMRSYDEKQSRVVRFSGSTAIQMIQYGNSKQPLFSCDVSFVLFLTENGNGDICVADYGGSAVVVLDSFGGLRFKYDGNLSSQSKYTQFLPMHIAADVNHQILIGDSRNNIVHIIDCNGNFVRYLEHSCNGGLSIDADNNLVIGDRKSGKIQFIKYLE